MTEQEATGAAPSPKRGGKWILGLIILIVLGAMGVLALVAGKPGFGWAQLSNACGEVFSSAGGT